MGVFFANHMTLSMKNSHKYENYFIVKCIILPGIFWCAITPEHLINKNTKNKSNVFYNKELEQEKGKFTSVDNHPETTSVNKAQPNAVKYQQLSEFIFSLKSIVISKIKISLITTCW